MTNRIASACAIALLFGAGIARASDVEIPAPAMKAGAKAMAWKSDNAATPDCNWPGYTWEMPYQGTTLCVCPNTGHVQCQHWNANNCPSPLIDTPKGKVCIHTMHGPNIAAPGKKIHCGIQVTYGAPGPHSYPNVGDNAKCDKSVVVKDMHYPDQTCEQSRANFVSTWAKDFHLTSVCAPGALLGVSAISCQDAPIPGFNKGAVWKATSCCGPAVAAGPHTYPNVGDISKCDKSVVVKDMHYPDQTCAQSNANFTGTALKDYHLTSVCAPGTLLGVSAISCQDAPIPGFDKGSVYKATSCCAPAVAAVAVCPDVAAGASAGANDPATATCNVYAKNPTDCNGGSLNYSPYFAPIAKAACDSTPDSKFCQGLNGSAKRPFVGFVKYDGKKLRPITCH